MQYTSESPELFDVMKSTLYTPVVGDILDTMGYTHQFLPQDIRPMQDHMKIAGRAMTVLMTDVFEAQQKPFGYLTECLDQLRENEIYIATGGTKRCAYWGELLTATARMRKAVGAVINGYHRDTPQVLAQHWPVFSCGCYAQDSSVRTQVIAYRCAIEIGQVTIHDGDFLFGDVDGIVVIPQRIAGEVIEKSLEKASGEKLVRKAIEGGMSATEAFETYGILQRMGKSLYQVHSSDNAATAMESLSRGDQVPVYGDCRIKRLTITEDIPQGHKAALIRIASGENVMKYGVAIGIAKSDIASGAWVHLHNVKSAFDERAEHFDAHTGVPDDMCYRQKG